MYGVAAAESPAASAPLLHLPPEATAVRQPTITWLATLTIPPVGVILPIKLSLHAEMALMNPACSANPRFPLVTPVTNAEVSPATAGRNGWQPGIAAQTAVTVI